MSVIEINDKNKIKKLILNGSFVKQSNIINKLTDEEINYFLYFSFENKMYESFELLLNKWNFFYFDDGKNILNSLLDNFFIHEELILSKIKKEIYINEEILDFYHNKFKSIALTPNFKGIETVWEDFFTSKKKQNFSNKLDIDLSVNNNKFGKKVKI